MGLKLKGATSEEPYQAAGQVGMGQKGMRELYAALMPNLQKYVRSNAPTTMGRKVEQVAAERDPNVDPRNSWLG